MMIRIEDARKILYHIDGAIIDDEIVDGGGVTEAVAFFGLAPGFGVLGCPVVICSQGIDSFLDDRLRKIQDACCAKYHTANTWRL